MLNLGESQANQGELVALSSYFNGKGIFIVAFGGDQVLDGRERKFANCFFNEMSSVHYM